VIGATLWPMPPTKAPQKPVLLVTAKGIQTLRKKTGNAVVIFMPDNTSCTHCGDLEKAVAHDEFEQQHHKWWFSVPRLRILKVYCNDGAAHEQFCESHGLGSIFTHATLSSPFDLLLTVRLVCRNHLCFAQASIRRATPAGHISAGSRTAVTLVPMRAPALSKASRSGFKLERVRDGNRLLPPLQLLSLLRWRPLHRELGCGCFARAASLVKCRSSDGRVSGLCSVAADAQTRGRPRILKVRTFVARW
jgi:hypothetical protein